MQYYTRSNKVLATFTLCLLAIAAAITVRAQSYSNTVMQLNPVGYWPLDETTPPPQPINITATNLGTLGATANGYYGAWYQPSGPAWYLTNNISLTTNSATADGDTALNCAYSPGQYIVLPRNTNGVKNSAVTIQSPFTIETWVKVGTTIGRLGGIVSQGEVQLNAGGSDTNNPFYGGPNNTTVWAGFALGQYQNFFFFSCFATNAYNNKSSELDGPKTLTVGQWVHLVAILDGNKEYLYQNGVQVGSKTIAANAKGLTYVPDPTSPLMIGSGSDVPIAYGNPFQGTLDEVAIYPTHLPDSSIQAHYQTAFGTNSTYGNNYQSAVLADSPMIYYRMNDNQYATNAGYPSSTFPVANNYGSTGVSGNGVYQPGTTPGVAGPTYTGFGANSHAVAINGFLGAVDVGSSNIPAALNPTGTVPLTVVSWFQTGPADAPGRFQEIVGHSDNSYRIALGTVAGENHFNPGPGPELQFTNAADLATNGFAFNDGRWHMAAGVTDGTNEFLYLDGALAKSGSNAAGINIKGTNLDLLLGGDPQYTVASTGSALIRNFDGQIAHVAIFSNALSAVQIQSLFNAAGVPPYIWQQPQSSLSVNANNNVSIPVGVRGSGPISYQWYQNGAPASSQTNSTLSFSPITTANAGTYYLVASNSAGSITSSVVAITVFGPPTIAQQTPSDLQIFVGSSPVLHVNAVGATPMSYQWSLNGSAISGATSSSFTVTNVQANGTYSCFLSNAVGTASIAPIAITALADPTAPFPSAVLANSPVAYFRLDESGGTTAYDYVGGNNGIYNYVTLGVSGYTSQNTVQSDPSETAAEFGDYPPNNDYAGSIPTYLNFGVANGGNAEFSVEAWITQFLYLNNGDAIVALGYGNGGEQFVLDTGNGANGALRFFVRNAAGTVSAAASTNVLANDGLWHHVVGVCDEAGGHVYLYLDGKLAGSGTITPNSGLLASSMPLSIGARESGNYSPMTNDFQFIGDIDDVAIYNTALSAGTVQSHYFASGVPPTVQVQPANVTTNQGAGVTFTAVTSGSTPVSYQWSDNSGSPISGATDSTLTLNNLQTSQSGNYSVQVANAYGNATGQGSLNVVLGAPTIVVDISPTNVYAYTGDPVSFSITVSGSQPLFYQWYQDGVAVPHATNATFSFASLAGTNTYYCAVSNSYSVNGPTYSSVATVYGQAANFINPANYNSSMKITFAGYTRNETLHDFPVLVRLGTNIPGFSYQGFQQPNGADLRFAEAGTGRELPYEIDQWQDSSGISSVWVQVPQISGTNDYIWAYWGNSSNTIPSYTTNGSVWTPASFEGLPGYEIVYHLKEQGFPYLDSTLNYPALSGNAPTSEPGIIGDGQLFNGSSSFLDAGTVTNIGDVFTLSSWVNVNPSASSIQTIWSNQKGGFGSAGFCLFINFYQTANGQILMDTGNGSQGGEIATATGTVPFGSWHQVSAAVNRTNGTVNLYLDGTPTPIVSGTVTPNFPDAGTDLNYGRFTNANFYFTGGLDEGRIHAGIDSSNWVWASFMTVASNSTFSAYGSVSSVVPPDVEITVQRSGNQIILTWPTGTLQTATGVAGPYLDLNGATSPYTNVMSGQQQFYRVRVQ